MLTDLVEVTASWTTSIERVGCHVPLKPVGQEAVDRTAWTLSRWQIGPGC